MTTKTLSAIALLSLAMQAFCFTGFAFLVFDLFNLTHIITPEIEQDSSLLLRYVQETFESYAPVMGIGLLGSGVAYAVLLKTEYRAPWFTKGTRVAGWLWLPFVPVGTVIGIVLLRACKATST